MRAGRGLEAWRGVGEQGVEHWLSLQKAGLGGAGWGCGGVGPGDLNRPLEDHGGTGTRTVGVLRGVLLYRFRSSRGL